MLEFDPMAVRARTALGDDNQRVWILEAAQQDIRLILESYAAHGGPTSPGTLEITEAEANYATCGLCLRVRTGCAEHEDHFHCEQTYMPEVGSTITITELGEADGELWVGSISEMVLRPVDIDPATFETAPTPQTEPMLMSTWDFSAPLIDVDAAVQEPCGGHGHLHGNHCHCDPGYRIDPQDPTNCIPG